MKREPIRLDGCLDVLLACEEWTGGMKFEGKLKGRALTPRPRRIEASFDVMVRCAAGDFEARVTNLSSSGFRLRCARRLEPGVEVLLEVPQMRPIKGVIRWVIGKDAGGSFSDAVAL